MSDRDAILSRLRPREPGPAPGTPAAVPALEGDLWEVFGERLAELGGRLVSLTGEVTLESLAVATELDLSSVVGDDWPGEVWTAQVGITRADLAIAETGSVLIRSGPGRARLHSLTPPVHVVLVHSIVAHLEEAMPEFAQDRHAVLITGPSRTADIEGVLVRGVHGPGELVVVRCSETPPLRA